MRLCVCVFVCVCVCVCVPVDAIKGKGLLPVQIEALWAAHTARPGPPVRVTVYSCPGRHQASMAKKKPWRVVGKAVFREPKEMTRIELESPIVIGRYM